MIGVSACTWGFSEGRVEQSVGKGKEIHAGLLRDLATDGRMHSLK